MGTQLQSLFIFDELDQLYATTDQAKQRHDILSEIAVLGAHNNGTTFALV